MTRITNIIGLCLMTVPVQLYFGIPVRTGLVAALFLSVLVTILMLMATTVRQPGQAPGTPSESDSAEDHGAA